MISNIPLTNANCKQKFQEGFYQLPMDILAHDLSASALRILAYINRLKDSNNEYQSTCLRIAKTINLSRSSVKRGIKSLKDAGFITTKSNYFQTHITIKPFNSFIRVSPAIFDMSLGDIEARALVVLGKCINNKNQCFPSKRWLSAQLDCSKSHITRTIKLLKSRGYITSKARNINGRQTSNLYTIMFDVIDRISVVLGKAKGAVRHVLPKKGKLTLVDQMKEVWERETHGEFRPPPRFIKRTKWLKHVFQNVMGGDMDVWQRYVQSIVQDDYCYAHRANIGMLSALGDKMLDRHFNDELIIPKVLIPDWEQKKIWKEEGKNIEDKTWRDARARMIKYSSVPEWKNWLNKVQFTRLKGNKVSFQAPNAFIIQTILSHHNPYLNIIKDAFKKGGIHIDEIEILKVQ